MNENLKSGLDLTKATVQKLHDPIPQKNKVLLDVLRTDLIHPIVSGNKWFKLKYHLTEAKKQYKKGIISAGGAYSNHLLALAYSCYSEGLHSIGIIRGEKPIKFSPTLVQAQQYGMKLEFVGREAFRDKNILEKMISDQFKNYYWVPEGGQSELGIKGASEILAVVPTNPYTHILCAVGTGTMMCGLVNAALPYQHICGIPVLKSKDPIQNDLSLFLQTHTSQSNYSLQCGFHEGGYAKKTIPLLQFMNMLYERHQLPTDFVYTGKLFLAIFTLIENDFFPPGSSLLAIHSGGLQGNRSLPPGSLNFTNKEQYVNG